MSDEKKQLPHHSGHRDRLRERFITSGEESLQDYELLEMLLFYSIPRKDVKPIAKDLLQKFGSLQKVLAAPAKELEKVKGITENSAVLIKNTYALTKRMLKEDVEKKTILNSWQKLLDYCHVSMAYEVREQFRILFLNRKNELIGDEVQQVGTVDHTPVYPREIVKSALDRGATAVILVHNHPSGDCMPSDSDIEMTEEIVKAASSMGIVVHDHVIISSKGTSSFKALGLLSNIKR